MRPLFATAMPAPLTAAPAWSDALMQACAQLAQEQPIPSLARLAQAAHMSPSQFHRRFQTATGLTPHAYAQAHRAQRLGQALAQAPSVTHAGYEAGYGSSGRLYAETTQALGMTPKQYRAGGKGARIRFAIGQSRLGAVLVAMSERGICALTMGDDPEALVHDLERRFPQATLVGDDPSFDAVVAQVLGLVEHPERGLDLPLDLQGTAFQQRVWQALRTIPPGQTVSYAEIAARIQQPKATRAVAQACGANPVAIAVPCHRVVRNDGALSGYRWGVARKAALLASEGAPGAD